MLGALTVSVVESYHDLARRYTASVSIVSPAIPSIASCRPGVWNVNEDWDLASFRDDASVS